MDTLNLLNNYNSTLITKSYLIKRGITIEEIEKLVQNRVLKNLGIGGVYGIDKNKIQSELCLEKSNGTISKIEFSRTGLSRQEVWKLFIKSQCKNPVMAKDFLLEYKRLCEIEGVLFPYEELTKIDERIGESTISKEQLCKEKALRETISKLMCKRCDENELSKLKRSITEFSKLYKNRGFRVDIYQGSYQSKIGNHQQAIQYYERVLKHQPWNSFVLRRLCFSLDILKRHQKLPLVMRQNLRYNPTDIECRIQLAKIYIRRGMFDRLAALTEEVSLLQQSDMEKYLGSIIDTLNNGIDLHIDELANFPDQYKYFRRVIDNLKEEVQNYGELYSQILDYSDIEKEMMNSQSGTDPYEEKVYYAMNMQNDGEIHPMNIETYVKNIEISEEEKLLLYIAAAKVMFIHKLPKYAEHYLALVHDAHPTSKMIKKQYDQCQRNKKLYLNK